MSPRIPILVSLWKAPTSYLNNLKLTECPPQTCSFWITWKRCYFCMTPRDWRAPWTCSRNTAGCHSVCALFIMLWVHCATLETCLGLTSEKLSPPKQSCIRKQPCIRKCKAAHMLEEYVPTEGYAPCISLAVKISPDICRHACAIYFSRLVSSTLRTEFLLV